MRTGFGRHRETHLNGNGVKKNGKKETVEEIVSIKSDEFPEEAVLHFHEEEEPEVIPEEKVITEVNNILKRTSGKKAKKKVEKIVINEEDIDREELNPKKNHYIDNTCIIGKNSICKDFRAICKKKDLKVNKVLNELLHKWNTENYCL